VLIITCTRAAKGAAALCFLLPVSRGVSPHTSSSNMARQKKKLTPAQKAAKKERQKKYKTVFMNGKQVRVKRPETIDGIDVDEFIRRNADPTWLHQNEMWEDMDQPEEKK